MPPSLFVRGTILYLVLVQFTVFVLCFTLLLEGNDDKTYKDVHHEKGYEDEIDDEEDGNTHTIVVYGAHLLSVGINCSVQQPESESVVSRLISKEKTV